MSRIDELSDTLIIGDRKKDELYGRIFVVSAFGGITNLLLEHKKTGENGVYAAFVNNQSHHGWHDALDRVADAMKEAHFKVLDNPADIERADADKSDFDAIVSASMRRLRPILMTMGTTVIGLMPLIIGRDALFYGMSSVIAFGLAVGTILTLGVTPVLYSLFFRIRYQPRSQS